MTWKIFLLPLAVVVMVACHYDKPLGPVTGLEAPAGLVGRWKITADAAENRDENQFLVVHQNAAKLLVVDYQISVTEHWYFTGYPCLAGHPEILEFQFLGDSTGKANTEKPFLLVRAKLEGDTLKWSTVDPDKLKPEDDPAAFRKAVLAGVEKGDEFFVKTQTWKRETPADK